jgi:hypothetical protein
MKKMFTLPVLLLVMFVFLAQGGCGGDDDPGNPAPEACSISVTNPISGASYWNGDDVSIRWRKTGSASQVDIKLLKGDNVVGNIGVEENTGYQGWTATTFGAATGDDYAIRVTAVGEDGCGDDSGRFTIINTEGCTLDFTINYDPDEDPDTPFFLEAGQEFEITWDSYHTAGSVDIELLRGDLPEDAPVGYIVSNTPDDGSFVWTVDSLHQGTYEFFYLRISARGVDGCSALSEQFPIIDEDICEILVNEPQPGTLWNVGEIVTITFTALDPATSRVQIGLYQGIELAVSLTPDQGYITVDNTGMPQDFSWMVDLTGYEPQGNEYRIVVRDADDQYCFGRSERFTINSN